MAQRSRLFKSVFGVVFFAVSILIVFLTARIGHVELGRPILLAIGALAIIIIIYPELYQRLWFWTAMMIFTALHIPVIVFSHWYAGWVPSPFVFVFCLADVAIMIWIINFIQKLTGTGANGPK
jgi:hypothetical protein